MGYLLTMMAVLIMAGGPEQRPPDAEVDQKSININVTMPPLPPAVTSPPPPSDGHGLHLTEAVIIALGGVVAAGIPVWFALKQKHGQKSGHTGA